jgi:hypothetical protein
MTVQSIQAPVGGINRFNSIDDMPAQDAYFLDNWIPDAGDCRLRGGSKLLANFGTVPIGTIIPYGADLILTTGGEIVDSGFSLSGPGLPGIGTPVVLGTGFTEDRWQWNVFGDNLLMVNGADTPQQWNGTTLQAINFTSGITTPAELIGVGSFKGRSIYWKNTEAGFYYAEAASYQGTMAYFDLSPFVSRLSNLAMFFTWSADAGDGPDDYAVFLMDTGEALVYQGSDPSSIDYWALIGRYQMGAPLSIRSSVTLAGDRLIMTREGWQNFKVIWDNGNFRDEGIGKKMVGLATQVAELYGFQVGWEANYYPEERLVVLNVPQGSGVAVQHCMSSNTGAWCTFSAWNAATFGTYGGKLYFGDSVGNIYIGMYGSDDDGLQIVTDAMPAFNYLGSRAMNKQLTGVRPVTTIDRPDTIGIDSTGDYVIPPAPTVTAVPTAASTSPWGSPWGSPWSAGADGTAKGEWQTSNAYGYSVTYRMKTVSIGQPLRWANTQLLFRKSGWL